MDLKMQKKKPLSMVKFLDQPKFSLPVWIEKFRREMFWYNLLFENFLIMVLHLVLIKIMLTCVALQNCNPFDKDQA